jgi:hypothetical protein
MTVLYKSWQNVGIFYFINFVRNRFRIVKKRDTFAENLIRRLQLWQ